MKPSLLFFKSFFFWKTMIIYSKFMKVLFASLLILLVGTYVSADSHNKDIPPNAHATGSDHWVCDTGYTRNGNECTESEIPDNAFSYGSGWKCYFSYKKIDESCIKEVAPNENLLLNELESNSNGDDSSTDLLRPIFLAAVGLVVAILIFLLLFDYEKKDFIKSIKLKNSINMKTKTSKNPKVNTDNDSTLDNTSGSEPASETEDTKEQTTEEGSSSSDLQENVAKQTNAIRGVKTDLSTLIKNVNDMTETFMSLQKSLDEKDEEIKRLKEGYDDVIVRKFLLRFTKVDKVLKEYMNEGQADLKGLEDIHTQLEDALLEANVEPFSPELGSDYKTTQGVADNPVIKDTTNEKQDSTIAEVLQVGYRRKLPDEAENEFQIIASAKVAIYVYKKPENH